MFVRPSLRMWSSIVPFVVLFPVCVYEVFGVIGAVVSCCVGRGRLSGMCATYSGVGGFIPSAGVGPRVRARRARMRRMLADLRGFGTLVCVGGVAIVLLWWAEGDLSVSFCSVCLGSSLVSVVVLGGGVVVSL